jgi:HAD superfamily hydrolase (TIGR01509 family)
MRRTADAGGIRALIFDMDGVLADSEPLHFEAARRVLARHGVCFTEAENQEFLGVTARETYATLCARHGLAVPADQLVHAYASELIRVIPTQIRPMAGVPEVLATLRAAGFHLSLASSAERAVISTTLVGLGVTDLFEVVVAGPDVGRGKPAPDIFLECARRLGLPAAACLVIEDSRNGVLAARAAGMPCAVIPCPATAHQDLTAANYRLPSLLALPAFLAARPVQATVPLRGS